MTEGNAQREWKKSCDASRADTTDFQRFEKVVFLAKS